MKNRLLLSSAVLAGAGLLSTGVPWPAAASAASASPAPASAASIECHQAAATLTVQHRAPVHTLPKGSSGLAYFASAGTSYRIGGYCDNSFGNRWYCVGGCDFESSLYGFWIFEEYFLD
ncbi:hypothetical protein [Nocardioides jensenii]|uniref:hypothetical protein n=1 Tax=Nocardioides jensenii TaxID=1843 RepID=UPI00083176A3|nr:hypothetical protein [Nocardioides jensenii]